MFGDPPVLKINCNAALIGDRGAFACALRNENGSLLECFGFQFSTSSVILADAFAIRQACLFCLKASISNVVIENDNSQVINLCSSNSLDPPWDCSFII